MARIEPAEPREQKTSDGAAERRNVAAQELATEGSTASANYTKCKFCIIEGSKMREKGISLRMPVSASVAREGFKTSILPFLRLR